MATSNGHGPLYGQHFGVIDLHTHPSLKTFIFGRKFHRRHWVPGFTFPFTLRTDIDALIDGGVKAFLCAAYVLEKEFDEDVPPAVLIRPFLKTAARVLDSSPYAICHEMLDHFEAVLEETRQMRGDVIERATSYQHMQEIMASGKVCVLHSIEGAHVLEGDLEKLDSFHQRGVSHMIVPHLYPNEACNCVDAFPDLPLKHLGCFKYPYELDSGLTPFGRDLIDKMLDIGMIVDMTHATPRCRLEMLERAKAHPKKRPVIMSHVGVHEYAPYPMNPTPEDIRLIADTGGVVGLIMMTHWLHEPKLPLGKEVVMKTIDHLIEHGGEEVVAFGSDFDGFTGPPRDMKSPRDYNYIRGLLTKRYTAAQVEKFLSGNADRVLREGWDAPGDTAGTAADTDAEAAAPSAPDSIPEAQSPPDSPGEDT